MMNREIIPDRKKGFNDVLVADALISSVKVLAALT